MSLMGTLGKVAMGVMIAKGVGKMISGSSGSNSGGGLGGLLGGLTGGSGGSSGGLGGLLGGLTGGSSAGSSAGGLGGLLGGLTGQGGAGGASGGLGGLIDSLGGNPGQATPYGTNAPAGNGGTKNFGDLFNTALQGEEPEVNEADEQNAKLMLRAMINAAKADGNLDSEEQAKITEHLQDATEAEIDFVREELRAPVDMESMIRDVPAGMEKQVYLMSLLGISLDTKEEAIYLDKLAQGLNISHEESNRIHDQLGAPKLYN